MKAKKTASGYSKKGRSAPAAKTTSVPAPKATPTAEVNMGLGKLKGVMQERKSRLDREIKRQGG